MIDSGLWKVFGEPREDISDWETKHRENTILPCGGTCRRPCSAERRERVPRVLLMGLQNSVR